MNFKMEQKKKCAWSSRERRNYLCSTIIFRAQIKHSCTNIKPFPISKQMCEFCCNVLLSEQGRGEVHWGSFWDGSGSQRKKGRVLLYVTLDEKSTFFYFMEQFEGSGKWTQTDPVLALCRRC
jgi:hypothetical protein